MLGQRIVVSAAAALAGVVYLAAGLRATGRESSAPTRYVVSGFTFLIAALVALGYLAPVVGYSITCVSLVVIFLADVVRDERARKRRVALLTPRPPVDVVPTAWIAIALLSTLTLIPYVVGGIEVVAALLAGVCAIAMAAIGWRVATAPTQLTSDDPRGESIRDRACRARQVGITCMLAIGSVFVFKSFVNVALPAVGGLGYVSNTAMMAVWVGLILWQFWYVGRVYHLANRVSS